MALQGSLLGIDEASSFQTFGSLKIRIHAKLLANVEKTDVLFQFILLVL